MNWHYMRYLLNIRCVYMTSQIIENIKHTPLFQISYVMEIYFRSVKIRGAFSIFPLRHQSKKYNTDLSKMYYISSSKSH